MIHLRSGYAWRDEGSGLVEDGAGYRTRRAHDFEVPLTFKNNLAQGDEADTGPAQRMRLESSAKFALFQEAVVMPHEQMCFHLAHRIQQDTDINQHTRAAKKLSDRIWN